MQLRRGATLNNTTDAQAKRCNSFNEPNSANALELCATFNPQSRMTWVQLWVLYLIDALRYYGTTLSRLAFRRFSGLSAMFFVLAAKQHAAAFPPAAFCSFPATPVQSYLDLLCLIRRAWLSRYGDALKPLATLSRKKWTAGGLRPTAAFYRTVRLLARMLLYSTSADMKHLSFTCRPNP